MEGENPIESMIQSWQWRDSRVATLYASKSIGELMSLFQNQFLDERKYMMRGSYDQLTLEDFHDWKLVFEISLALMKLGMPSQDIMTLLNVLAMHMYMDDHRRQLVTKVAAGVGIATVLFFVPYLLHTFGFNAKKKN